MFSDYANPAIDLSPFAVRFWIGHVSFQCVDKKMLINLDKAVGKIVSFWCLNMFSCEFMRFIQEIT